MAQGTFPPSTRSTPPFSTTRSRPPTSAFHQAIILHVLSSLPAQIKSGRRSPAEATYSKALSRVLAQAGEPSSATGRHSGMWSGQGLGNVEADSLAAALQIRQLQHSLLPSSPPYSRMAEPAFDGFVESTLDALLIFEGCRRGALPKISRRLQEFEKRALVVSEIGRAHV